MSAAAAFKVSVRLEISLSVNGMNRKIVSISDTCYRLVDKQLRRVIVRLLGISARGYATITVAVCQHLVEQPSGARVQTHIFVICCSVCRNDIAGAGQFNSLFGLNAKSKVIGSDQISALRIQLEIVHRKAQILRKLNGLRALRIVVADGFRPLNCASFNSSGTLRSKNTDQRRRCQHTG